LRAAYGGFHTADRAVKPPVGRQGQSIQHAAEHGLPQYLAHQVRADGQRGFRDSGRYCVSGVAPEKDPDNDSLYQL